MSMGELGYVEKGKGRAVVLLHGFPLDSRIWRGQVEGLSDRYRVIAVDLEGFGGSKSERAFTMGSLAEGVHGLLERIGALPCVIGGLSMGGYVALAYYRKYAGQVLGLMLVDTKASADTPEGREGRNKMVELVRNCGSKAVADQMMPKMLADNTVVTQPETVRLARQIMEECPARTIEHACVAMRDREDSTDLLPSIAEPTLIVVGEHDAITPVKVAEGMKERVAHAKVAVIPDAGHLSPMENPGAVNRAMREFLGGIA